MNRLANILRSALIFILVSSSTPQFKPSVTVSVYYETICPECQKFFNEQLCPVSHVDKLGFYFNLNLVPYGNASIQSYVDPKRGPRDMLVCKHGPDECKGNINHACARRYFMDRAPNQEATSFICCTMAKDNPPEAGPECANEMKAYYDSVRTCTNDIYEGVDIMKKYYKNQTDSLNPKPTSWPWITFNGVYNESDMAHAKEDLLTVICKHMDPSKEIIPEICQKVRQTASNGVQEVNQTSKMSNSKNYDSSSTIAAVSLTEKNVIHSNFYNVTDDAKNTSVYYFTSWLLLMSTIFVSFLNFV